MGEVPRTYRIEGPILAELEEFRRRMPVPPSRNTFVNYLLREGLKQARKTLIPDVTATPTT